MTLPLADPAQVDALAVDLRTAGYTTDGVADLLGADAGAAFSRGLWWSALRATDRAAADQQRLATLVRLFLLGADEPRERVVLAFPGAGVDALTACGVVEATPAGALRAVLDIRPHSDGARDFLVVSDQDAALRPGPVRRDHVLGIGGASVSLAHAVVRAPVERALDLGTGCGIQALHLARHCEDVVATDTNERALALAAATARLNGMSWDLRRGSLFEPVAGERFDLIVSNPPFVVGVGALDYIYRDSGMAGDASVPRTMIRAVARPSAAGRHRADHGELDRARKAGLAEACRRLARRHRAARVGGTARVRRPDQLRLAVDLRCRGDPRQDAARRGGRWLDWFDEQGIAGIGMGMVVVRAPRRGETRPPDQVFEEITGADEALTGPEVEAYFARREYLHDTSDDRLLATRLSTAPVFLEEQSLPGPDGWQMIGAAVRRPGGPGAVLGVDEVSRALLAGCRGEVPLGTLIELLAAYHGVDADALATAALPVVREAIGRGILYEAR